MSRFIVPDGPEKAHRGRPRAGLGVTVVCLVVAAGCESPSSDPVDLAPRLVDITDSVGLAADGDAWSPPSFETPEITGGGLAVLDYDNDGRLDILQIRHPPPGTWTAASEVDARNRLYRQEPDGRFTDVTEVAGIGDPGHGHGVAVGDVDNDGDVDVYVANYGEDGFYRNNGDGTFVPAAAEAGFAGEQWSSSAAFLDYDRDGDLDLYVVHFARFDPDLECRDARGERDFCAPQRFDGVVDTLYRNDGSGRFEDVTHEAGIRSPGRGWGLVSYDVTGDGLVDIYVANDEEPNHLWVNQGDGTFREDGVAVGIAVNGAGDVEASMGVAAGDTDGEGEPELFVTHIEGETNTLYRPISVGMFEDASATSGLGAASLPMTGWGCGFLDVDLDGDLDLAVVNGRVARRPYQSNEAPRDPWDAYREANALFENDGSGRFRLVENGTGRFGRGLDISRGLALGDLDGDGDVDLVVNTIGNTLRLYRNDAPAAGAHWLIVRPMTGRRDAYGAVVTLEAGSRRLVRIANPGYGYLSSNDPRAHFGLGPLDRVDSIAVTWPDGTREQFGPAQGVNRVVTVRQGTGTRID